MRKFIDQCDDYMNHRLKPSEKAAFESEMQTNPKLRTAVEHYASLKVLALGNIEAETRQTLSNLEVNSTKQTPTLNWLCLIGILAALLLALYFCLDRLTPSEPINYASVYVEPNWNIQRNSSNDSLSLALSLALQGRKDSAFNILDQLAIPQSEKYYWKAEIFAKINNPDSVLYYLPKAQASSIYLRDRLNYLGIITNMELGNSEELNALYLSLPTDTDAYYLEKYKRIFK